MKNHIALTALAAIAGLLLTSGTASAQTASFADKGLQSNGFERWANTASVGKYGGGNFETTGYVIFSTQAILANEASMSAVGDFATTALTLSFDTITNNNTSSPDLGAGTFTASYLGFFANVASLATNDFWNGGGNLNGLSVEQFTDTGITDTAGDGQSLAVQFTLSDAADTNSSNVRFDVTEADSANDYVAFKFSYTGWASLPSNTVQELGNFTLSTGVVPEPSSFALIAGMFGLTCVMLRRRA